MIIVNRRRIAICILTLAVAACASTPPGPSQVALPGSGKNFDQFRVDDYDCRQYASAHVGTTPDNEAARRGAASAAIGTGIGALAGAALGGGRGAAGGAGVGLLFGSAVGANAAQQSAANVQARYDGAYTQCMYGRGNKVAVNAQGFYTEPGSASPPAPPPPPPVSYPPTQYDEAPPPSAPPPAVPRDRY